VVSNKVGNCVDRSKKLNSPIPFPFPCLEKEILLGAKSSEREEKNPLISSLDHFRQGPNPFIDCSTVCKNHQSTSLL